MSYFLPEPVISLQTTQSTCWAAVMESWANTTGCGGTRTGPFVEWGIVDQYRGRGMVYADGSLKPDQETLRTVLHDFGCSRVRFFNRHELKAPHVLDTLRSKERGGSGYFVCLEAEVGAWKHGYLVYGYSTESAEPWWHAMNPDSVITGESGLASAPIPKSPGRWGRKADKDHQPTAGDQSWFVFGWQEP